MGRFLSFSQDFSWFFLGFSMAFRVFPGLFKFFPAPSSRKVVLPLIGGERESCVALNAGNFQDLRRFFAKFSLPRVPGKSCFRKVAFPGSRASGKWPSRKVARPESRVFSKFLGPVLPESRSPGKSRPRKVVERGPVNRDSISRVPPESR